MTLESEEDESQNIICSSSSYERSFSEEEEEEKKKTGEWGNEGAGNRGYYEKEGTGERRYFGKGNGDRVLVRVHSETESDEEEDPVLSLKGSVNRIEEMTRSMTHPIVTTTTDPLGQENRRMTLPAMMVTPYSGASSSSSSSSEDVTVKGGTLPNRTGFRRRARRRKMNSRNSIPASIPLTRPNRPLSAGNKAATLDTLSALPFSRGISRSTGNLLEDTDPVYTSPVGFNRKRDPLAPPNSIIQSVSPSPRRRSSLLVALSGMLSKSQSNLLDVGEEVLTIKVIPPSVVTTIFHFVVPQFTTLCFLMF